MDEFIRLYLVPYLNAQQIIDVPNTALILSQGTFQPVQTAPSVTLTAVPVNSNFTPFNAAQMAEALATAQTQELRICFREPSDIQQYPDTDVIEATDPTGGVCVCLITCDGTNISYVQVYDVTQYA